MARASGASDYRSGELSHQDERGAAHMVDITEKATTKRTAVAAGILRTSAQVVALISTGGLPKGDALATARVAGIMAAKRTSDLIPLCHQLAHRTGVEMEALTAVSVAALTLYDMIKAVDPGALIDDIRVLHKEGGRRGTWTRR